MRPDIRIRIRGGVIRVRIAEACIRTVIRITAEQDTARATNPLLFTISTPSTRGRVLAHKGRAHTGYTLCGIKQRRDPKYADVPEGA